VQDLIHNNQRASANISTKSSSVHPHIFSGGAGPGWKPCVSTSEILL